jgi:hypothetical protein
VVPLPTPFPANPKDHQLYLQDGDVLVGEISLTEIRVATEFGTLTVPLSKVRSLIPGLASSPQLAANLASLIEALGEEDSTARDRAQKELAALGPKVRRFIDARKNDPSAERARRIGELLKALDELDESGETAEAPWIQSDTVVTTEFTIVGKVSPAILPIGSKYGPLKVDLADLRRAQRDGVSSVVGATRLVNLARGKRCTASGSQEEHPAEHAADGNVSTRWCAPGDELGHWWQVDLGKAEKLSGVRITWEYDHVNYRYNVEGSADGQRWRMLSNQSQTVSLDQIQKLPFQAEGVRHVRITVTGLPTDTVTWPSFYEVEVFNAPADGTASIPPPAAIPQSTGGPVVK